MSSCSGERACCGRHAPCCNLVVLGWIATGWVLGLGLHSAVPGSAGVLLAAVVVLTAGSLVRYGAALEASLWRLVGAALALSTGLAVAPVDAPTCAGRGSIGATASVDRVRFGIDEADVWLRLNEGRWRSTGALARQDTLIRIRTAFASAPPLGSIVRFWGDVRPATVLRNPSINRVKRPPTVTSCWGNLDQGSVALLSTPAHQQWIAQARGRVRSRLIEGLPQDVSGVARALVLGDGGALPYERRKTIAAVGLAHLFAVSGLHIALVSGTLVTSLGWLLRGLTLGLASTRVAAALGVPLTLLHAAFAGGAPSAWRAACTAALTWLLVAIGRRASPTAVTAAAALLLSVPDPPLATRPAFLLSIVATTAILGASSAARGRWRRIRAASTVSARTLIATAPLVWWWFGGVPLIGWVTNLVVLPLGTFAVIPLAHAYGAIGGGSWVGDGVAWTLTHTTRWLLGLCDLFAPLAVTRQLPPLDALQGLTVGTACVLILVVREWKSRTVIVAVASLLWGAAEWRTRHVEQPEGAFRATFLDVGQGDAALIDFPDGSIALVDTGRGGRHPAARELLRILRERRRSRLDRVIITHGHPDHDGALAEVLEEIDVGELWLNGQRIAEETNGSLAALVSKARASGTRVRFPVELCGTHVLGDAAIEVLWPCPRYDPALDFNDNSLTVRIRYGGHALLLAGDLEAEAERQLLQRVDVGRATVLKVAHHGSKTSTTASWVAVARPSLAVISAGRHNRYGHPHDTVVRRLQTAGARVLRTDRHGAITVTVDHGRAEVHTMSGTRLTLARPQAMHR